MIDLEPTELERQIFPECAAEIIAKIAASSYGRFGNLSVEAAKVAQQVAKVEGVSPELLALTWLNEATFRFNPPPNTNGHAADFEHWDVGAMQLNVFWTRKSVERGEAKALEDGANWSGSLEFNSDGSPANFNGDPVANVRMAARRLLAIHVKNFAAQGFESEEEMRAVKYTGPGAQPYRLQSWREYSPLFKAFFLCFEV